MIGGLTPQPYNSDDIYHVLRLAFGRYVDYHPIPVVDGAQITTKAYALQGADVPPQVMLLRYSPAEQQAAFRAFKVLRALHEQGHAIPVPKVYYMGWTTNMTYTLLLLEQIPGRGAGSWRQHRAFFGRVGPQFATTLARLHQLPWKPMPDLVRLPFAHEFHRLTLLIRHLNMDPLHQIFDWLVQRAGHINELPHTVIHGDYKLNNVLAHQTHIVALQGWDHALIADPRFDVGYASAMLGAVDPRLAAQFAQQYAAAMGGPIADLPFWEVFGALQVLTRVARTISRLPPLPRVRFLERAETEWNGLLDFIELRTGMAIQ